MGRSKGRSSRFVADPPSRHYCPAPLYRPCHCQSTIFLLHSPTIAPPPCPAVLTRALRSLNVSAADAAQIESAITSLPARVDRIARSVNSGRRTLEENVGEVGSTWLDLWGR